ncbi:MAG: SRPBCC family protein [Geminicoccaceae bacterium]|nr:SRPBCC family protein [Geminicoccaceae bacterium]
MPKVTMSTKVAANADQLWKTIGGFGQIADWHPAIEKSQTDGERKGSVRSLTLVGGGSLNEKLEEISPSERIYRYSIISGPLPVANYEAVIHVRDNGDGTSTVEWSSEFDASGASENDAVAAIQGVYQAGLDNIRKMFGV